jgi:hypothetical protein
MNSEISRRTVLRGLGAAVALPMLEAMGPLGGLVARAAPAEKTAPKRLAFIFVPNGIHMPDWTPAEEGPGFTLPKILEPLAELRDDFSVLSELALDAGRPHGDGPGDHARAASTFLTGMHPRKTHGADIHVGVSVDQIAAKQIGNETRFRSLELGCERGAQAGNCDSGYSCAYSSNIAWSTPSAPVAKEVNPRLVFERLFFEDTAGAANPTKRIARRRSVLDFVLEDARGLEAKLGAKDRRKLDEYLTGIREVERRIARAGEPIKQVRGFDAPAGRPDDFGEYVRLMGDLIALAFQGDVTRICTFMIANAGSNRSYEMIGVSDGHHYLSHHEGKEEKQKKISKINRFHIEQLAYLLKKLKSVKEGESNLLDNSMIVYGSGLGDGNRHNHNNLPILLAGKGGGTIQAGRHFSYPRSTPLTNLYLSVLQRAGVKVAAVADSSGPLENLAG